MSIQSNAKDQQSPTEIVLPEVILDYIAAANEARIEDATACFTDTALVHDENHDYRGREAIRDWIAETTRSSQPKNEVVSVRSDGTAFVVISTISGNFPGSPVDLEFRFEIVDGKIAKLVIE